PKPFLYGYNGTNGNFGIGDGTSITMSISATASGISFATQVGAVGVFVEGGTASLGGPVQTANVANSSNHDPLFTFDNNARQLAFVLGSNAASLTIGLQGASGNSTTDASGTRYYLTPTGNQADGTQLS